MEQETDHFGDPGHSHSHFYILLVLKTAQQTDDDVFMGDFTT